MQMPASAAIDEEEAERISFLVNAGASYAAEGEYEDAKRAYLRALEIVPNNPDVRFRLSTLYIQMALYKEAVDLLEEMAAEFPDNPLIRNNLAWVYATGGAMRNGKLALHHAREALLSAPAQPSMWNTLAEAYFVSGQYDLALRSSEHAFDLLQSQRNASEQEVKNFQTQYQKIRRADEAYKRFMGIDPE